MVEYQQQGNNFGWTQAGAALGALSFLGFNGNGCGNGCGNGFNFGWNRGCGCGNEAGLQYVSELQAKVQGLEAKINSDQGDKEVYQQTLKDNKDLRDELFAFLKPLSEEAANNRVQVAVLAEKVKGNEEKAIQREANIVCQMEKLGAVVNGRFTALDQTIACIAGKVDCITNTSVDGTKVCPAYMPLYNSWTAPTAAAPTNVQIQPPYSTGK